MRKLIVSGALLLAGALVSAPAFARVSDAQPQCGDNKKKDPKKPTDGDKKPTDDQKPGNPA